MEQYFQNMTHFRNYVICTAINSMDERGSGDEGYEHFARTIYAEWWRLRGDLAKLEIERFACRKVWDSISQIASDVEGAAELSMKMAEVRFVRSPAAASKPAERTEPVKLGAAMREVKINRGDEIACPKCGTKLIIMCPSNRQGHEGQVSHPTHPMDYEPE